MILDAIGKVPIFHSLLKNFDEEARRNIIRRSVVLASAILSMFSVLGMAVPQHFNISMGDFKTTSE